MGVRSRLVGVLAMTVLLAVPAFADTGEKSDPDDSPGVLDIASVAHGHHFAFGRNKLEHTITTQESWGLDDVNSNDSIQIEFQLPGDNRTSPPERLLVINVKNGELKAKLYNTLGDPPKFVANVSLSRPDNRSVRVRFGKHLLRKHLKSYKYRVFTYYEKTGSDCNRPEACQDATPDIGDSGNRVWIRHDL
ncbi:MAG: hypothetical protein QOG04_1095 [Actinomycetota bacterium]|jgi:hypothetical protein|nr:hypothetical protein [Actinomycetota bacterium]